MPDTPRDQPPDVLQLLEELQRLEDEHRTLDLRDPAALDTHRQKIDALRQKIKALDEHRRNGRDRCVAARQE
jgi:hypothetical protein